MQVNMTIRSQMEDLKTAMLSAAAATPALAAAMDKLDASVATLEARVEKMGEAHAKAAKKAATAADVAAKASEKQAAATAKAEQAALDEAEALELMASRAEMAANRLGLQGEAAAQAVRIGTQYASILRETGSAQSELMKAWQAGLSPAENSARKLVVLSSRTEETTLASDAAAHAVGELSLRLEDQARRAATNVGTQNKLSRSLSELFDELKASQQGTLAVALAQAKGAETAEDIALAMRQLAFDTADADKETAEYKATLAAMQSRMTGLRLEEDKAKKATNDLADAYGKQKQKLDALETAMDALSIPGAGLVTRFKQMSDSLETMSEHGSTGQSALLKTGIAVGAVGMAAAAAVAGVVAVGAAIVAVSSQADEWNRELEKLGLKLDQFGTARVDRAAASIDAIGSSAKMAGVAFAESLAPDIEAASTRLVALGFAAVDAFKNLQEGEGVIDRLTRYISDGLVEALFLPITLVGKLAEAFEYLGLAPREGVEALKASIASIKSDQADAVTAALKALASDAIEPLIAVTDDYMGKAEALVTRQTAVNKASRDGAKAANEQARAVEKLAKVEAERARGDYADALKFQYEDEQSAARERHQDAEDSRKEMVDALKFQYEWNEAIAAADAAEAKLATTVQTTTAAAATSLEKLKAATMAIIDPIVLIASGVGGVVSSLIDKVIQQATGVDLWSLLLENGADAGKVLSQALAKIDFSKLIEGLASGFISVLDTLDNPAIWEAVVDGLAGALSKLADNAAAVGKLGVTIVKALANALPTLIPGLIEAGINIAVGLIEALPDVIVELADAMPDIAVGLIEALIEGIPDIVVALVEHMPEIVNALAAGIGAMVLRLVAEVAEAIGLGKVAAGLNSAADTVMGSVGSSSSASNSTPQTVVTDAYYPAVAGRRTIELAPGDVADVSRGGALGANRSDPKMLEALERQTSAILEQNAMMRSLRAELLIQRHQMTVAGPAGRY